MSATVSITEDDYLHLSTACIGAWDAGAHDTAQGLNRLGRKMNAALSLQAVPRVGGMARHTKVPKVEGPLDAHLKERARR